MFVVAWSKLGGDHALRAVRRAGGAKLTTEQIGTMAAVSVAGDARLIRGEGSARVCVGSVRPANVSEKDLDELTGDFALVALYPHSLECVRGRVGGHPLYFTILPDSQTFIASSMLEPLLRVRETSASLDVERLALWVATITNVASGDSPYREIQSLLPGERLLFAGENVRRGRTQRRIRPLVAGSADELAEELRARILASVRRAVNGRSHIGILAGGGIDSSGILAAALAIARGAQPAQVTAIALHFACAGDDRPHLRALAASLGIVPMRLSPSQSAAFVPSSFVIDGAPYVMHSAAWESMMMRAAREMGADLVLTGVGGDDVFEGDLSHFARLAESGNILRASVDAMRLRVYWKSNPAQRLFEYVLRPSVIRPVAQFVVPRAVLTLRQRRAAGFARPWATHRLRNFIMSTFRTAVPGVMSGATPQQRFSQFAYSPSVGDVARRRAQIEGVTCIRRIDPYLDEDIVEFMARVPPEMVLSGHHLRGLLRLALKGWIPESVRLRPDKAEFAPALTQMVGSTDSDELADLANVRELAALGLVESRTFRKCFDALSANKCSPALWSRIWAPLSVEAFLRWDRQRRSRAVVGGAS